MQVGVDGHAVTFRAGFYRPIVVFVFLRSTSHCVVAVTVTIGVCLLNRPFVVAVVTLIFVIGVFVVRVPCGRF